MPPQTGSTDSTMDNDLTTDSTMDNDLTQRMNRIEEKLVEMDKRFINVDEQLATLRSELQDSKLKSKEGFEKMSNQLAELFKLYKTLKPPESITADVPPPQQPSAVSPWEPKQTQDSQSVLQSPEQIQEIRTPFCQNETDETGLKMALSNRERHDEEELSSELSNLVNLLNKLDFPIFDKDDAPTWLHLDERYFSNDQKFDLGYLSLSGKVHRMFNGEIRSIPFQDWLNFKSTLWLRCGRNLSPAEYEERRNNWLCFKDGEMDDSASYEEILGSWSFLAKYLYWFGLQKLSSYGQNLDTRTSVLETMFAIFVAIFGLFFVLLIGNMQTYLQSIMVRLEEWRLKRRETDEWMRHRQLQLNIRERVRCYVHYKWLATRCVKDEIILHSLPADIRRDIQRHPCIDLVRHVPLFAQMDDQLLVTILTSRFAKHTRRTAHKLKEVVEVPLQPTHSKIHPVFHFSLLKPALGQHHQLEDKLSFGRRVVDMTWKLYVRRMQGIKHGESAVLQEKQSNVTLQNQAKTAGINRDC